MACPVSPVNAAASAGRPVDNRLLFVAEDGGIVAGPLWNRPDRLTMICPR